MMRVKIKTPVRIAMTRFVVMSGPTLSRSGRLRAMSVTFLASRLVLTRFWDGVVFMYFYFCVAYLLHPKDHTMLEGSRQHPGHDLRQYSRICCWHTLIRGSTVENTQRMTLRIYFISIISLIRNVDSFGSAL